MRNRIAVAALSTLLLMAQADTNFNPNVSANVTLEKADFKAVAVPPFSLTEFADKLEEKLKDKSAGYQFVVSFNDQPKVKRAGGMARKSPDGNTRAMTTDDRYNLASVSKTITAAAALKVLREKNVSVDSTMSKFLPNSFTIGPNVNTITFRELLTHRSGIRCGKSERAELEACIAAGIKTPDKAVREYDNSNFALFRFLIPGVEDFVRGPQAANQFQLAKDYPKRYMAYVQKAVFDPAGLPQLFCKPTATHPALTYQFPCPEDNGGDYGDATAVCGSKGWNLSTEELATFISALLYTEKILPKDLREQMKNENLGIYKETVEGSVLSYSHGGFFPGKRDNGTNWNPGELNSLAFGMSNGVSVALIVNSQFGTNKSIGTPVKDTAKEMIK